MEMNNVTPYVDSRLLSQIRAHHETILYGAMKRIEDAWELLNLLRRDIDLTVYMRKIERIAGDLRLMAQDAARKEDLRQAGMRDPKNNRYWVFEDDETIRAVDREEFVRLTGEDPTLSLNEDWETEGDPTPTEPEDYTETVYGQDPMTEAKAPQENDPDYYRK